MTIQMKATLLIAKHPLVRDVMLPHVDVDNEQIDFNKMNYDLLCPAGKTLVAWAWCIWKDEQVLEKEPEFKFHLGAGVVDPFYGARFLDPELRAVVLKALAMRWELTLQMENNLIH